MNDLSGPFATRAFRSKLGRDAGQEDTHRRQPLLVVDHADGLDYPRRPGLWEGEECAAVVRCVGTTYRDRQEVLNQSFDVSLTPTVPTLSARHNILDLTVQEVQEFNVMGLHGDKGASGSCNLADKPAVGPRPCAGAVLERLRRTLRIPRN